MKDVLFELEESRLKEEISKRGAKRVLLQLPDGLKPQGPRLAAVIEHAGADAIISGDPCYGACDLPLCEAESLKVDLVVHYGHTGMVGDEKTRAPTIYVEARADIGIEKVVEMSLSHLELWHRIGLATTIQHIHMLSEARQVLEAAGKTVYVGDAGHMKYPGQVLGCDYSNAKSVSAKVEAFLFVGGGRFHALGLSLATMKPIVVADPFEQRAYPIEAEGQKTLKRRWSEISQARKAETFGVIVGLKPGQMSVETALEIKKDLERSGKKAVLLALREIVPGALMQFPTIEAHVNTACPRIALDEPSAFTKPVLTVREAYVALGKIGWEDLLNEGFI